MKSNTSKKKFLSQGNIKWLPTVFDTYAWLRDITLEDYGVSEMFKIQL
jgi:hypothetical protein